ncbi:MAG: SAM-dependent methyltransferase [Marinilabiliaceae bacterium]|nr:SAM-dependent methyltransferase [Marinilabiliaceae bacterium]
MNVVESLNIFYKKLALFIENKELDKLLLSEKRDKSSDLKNVIITLVKLKKGFFLNFVYRYKKKDITKNYSLYDGFENIKWELLTNFYNANLFSQTHEFCLQTKPNGKVLLTRKKLTVKRNITFNHDKTKPRLIQTYNNTYLKELGVVNSKWEIRQNMNNKYQQICQYIELIQPYLTDKILQNDCQIVDMGSGKGYLTFALYDYISNVLQKNIKMRGIEANAELVSTCNTIVKKSNFDNLNFIEGTIKDAELNRIDILIALHACDTATDDAIYRGIISKSSLIVCAPCCHKQIRKELNSTTPFDNITKFGILKERQAEIITDTIRALILEIFGYKTNVFEFISTEHTHKNVMIVGEKIRKNNPQKQKILNNITSLKQIFGIKEHYLEGLLKENFFSLKKTTIDFATSQ